MKLNVDGSALQNSGSASQPAGARGLIRNSRREWIVGFMHKLGHSSNNLAE